MEKETIEALKEAGRSLNDLVQAWGNLVKAYENPVIGEILNIDYPFSESFDELYFRVLNWNFSAGEEIDIVLGVEGISKHIENMGLSDECNEEIVKRLQAKFETGF